MNGPLRFRFFAHSWISDWNHGNAHFLRGLASELCRQGHEVRCYEERDSWSMRNLVAEGADVAAQAWIDFRRAFPDLEVRFYSMGAGFQEFIGRELADADVVVVHEWNEPEIVLEILAAKPKLGFRALFHDTHHRAYSRPGEILRFPLDEFDGVLAFGEAIRKIYQGLGVKRVWTFHEAADIEHFCPQSAAKDTDVVWIGNWGDEERSRELYEFLIAPAAALREWKFAVHGVRYPEEAKSGLKASGIEYHGYLPNLRAPELYARSRISLHIPRQAYANGLSGVPTIRVFEVLASGAPLVSSPWQDTEGLFRPGRDYLAVQTARDMIAELKRLLGDERACRQMAESGRETILARHTCRHRAEQLMDICSHLEE